MLRSRTKWLYATTLLVLFYSLTLTMSGQASEPSVNASQTASSSPQSQSPSQAVDYPPLKPTDDQSLSNQPQVRDSGEKGLEKEPGNKTHFRLGTVSAGVSYAHFPNGFFTGALWPYGFYPYPYSFYPYGFGYAPFYYDYPLFFAYAPDLAYGLGKGEVKLAADPKTASVYLDGAYAGTARELKSMWLEPGAYDLGVSAPGHQEFHQRIYVLSGKSLKIAARLAPPDKTPQEESPAKSQKKSPEKSQPPEKLEEKQ